MVSPPAGVPLTRQDDVQIVWAGPWGKPDSQNPGQGDGLQVGFGKSKF